MFIFCVLGILKWWLKSSVQWYTWTYRHIRFGAGRAFRFEAAVCVNHPQLGNERVEVGGAIGYEMNV